MNSFCYSLRDSDTLRLSRKKTKVNFVRKCIQEWKTYFSARRNRKANLRPSAADFNRKKEVTFCAECGPNQRPFAAKTVHHAEN